MKVTAEQYGDICDIIYRSCPHNGLRMGDREDDPYLHTSDVARRATNLILEVLGLDIKDQNPRPEQLKAMADYLKGPSR